jgi:type IV pilus assembly protein PilA
MKRLNDRRDAAADLGEDAGFTLIELMVVLLILAILLAIAIPTFLGVTGGANDRAAQSNLNTALTTAKSAAANNSQTYQGIAVTKAQAATAGDSISLEANEPSISWQSGAVGSQGPVSGYVSSDGNGIILATWSKNNGGTCFYASDNQQTVTDNTGPYSGTTYAAPTAVGTVYAEAKGVVATSCNATAALPTLDNDGTSGSPVYWVGQTSNLK